MKLECWLTLSAKKVAGGLAPSNVKLYLKKPASTAGVTIKMDIELPDVLFQKPVIEAKLSIPDQTGGQGWKITAEAKDKLQDILIEQLGMHVELSAK